MALPVRSLAIFAGVVVAAGLFAASGLSLTAGMVTEVAANAPIAAGPLKPSYVVRLPTAKAETLNVAKSVPVKPIIVTSAAVAPVTPPPATAELTVTAKPTFSHQVVASGANVRSGPKKSFPQVFTLRQGTWVNVSDNVRGWVKVTDETGREGWVYGSLLQAGSPANSGATIIQ
ncbi:SH3 domain-containing protein [Devosia sp. CN2-171]|uniref:SH3 domain-containing protein n=1 Tax=Devosia sp. CN2-171 TaxID=3400909 RepID=UPI003BF7B118